MARGPMAGVSGPGKFSKRTDGLSFQSTEYGSGVENTAAKAGAPLAKTADAARVKRNPVTSGTRLYDDSQRPDEEVTAGIDIGPGPGSEVLPGGPQEEDDINFRSAIREYMPVLAYIASLPNTSPETRKAIRELRDNL
jgi:hypothetical protein